MAWTDFPVAPGDDIQTSAYRDLSLAFHERGVAVDAIDPGGFVDYGPYAVVGNPGDIIQNHTGSSVPYTWPSAPFAPDEFGWREWQIFGDITCIVFLDMDYVTHVGHVGFQFTDWLLDEPTYRTKALINPAGYTRHYWRLFTNFSDTSDQEGDAFVVGNKALRQGDGLVYQYSGGGTWTLLGQLTPTRRPDTATKFGYVEAGDIIQEADWMNEIYRGFHLLEESYSAGVVVNTTLTNVNGVGQTTVPAAITDSHNQWDLNETVVGIPYFMAAARLTSTTPSPQYVLDLQGYRGRLTFTAPVAISTTINFYAHTDVDLSAVYAGNQTFDDNGFGLVVDSWNNFSSVGPAFQTVVNSSFLGKSAPTDYPGTPVTPAGPPVATEVRGFRTTQVAVTVHWNFVRP